MWRGRVNAAFCLTLHVAAQIWVVNPNIDEPAQDHPKKVKLEATMRHAFTLRDGQADVYGGHDYVPETFVVSDLHMKEPDGTMLPGQYCRRCMHVGGQISRGIVLYGCVLGIGQRQPDLTHTLTTALLYFLHHITNILLRIYLVGLSNIRVRFM